MLVIIKWRSCMANLYLMVTIVDRKVIKKYLDLYEENHKHVSFLSLGSGTAANEILDYLGLESSEKAVSFMVVDEPSWSSLKNQLQKKQ